MAGQVPSPPIYALALAEAGDRLGRQSITPAFSR
jgi:hypothetical protein